MEPSTPRARTLVGLLLLAAALRLVSWLGAPMMDDLGPDLLWQAQRILAGDAAAMRHPCPPGYALATAAVALLARDVLVAGLLVSVLAGVLATWAAWSIARTLLADRPRAALAAGLLACVHGASLARTADIDAEGLALALFAAAGALLLGAARRGGWRWPLAGAVLGLALFTSPAGLALTPGAVLALVSAGRRTGWLRALGAAACLAAPGVGLALAMPMHADVTRTVGAPREDLPAGCPLAAPVVPRAGPMAEAPPPAPAAPWSRIQETAGWDILALAAAGLATCWSSSRPATLAGALLVVASLPLAAGTAGHHVPAGLLGPLQLLLVPAGAALATLWDAGRWRLAARLAAAGVVAWQAGLGLAERHPEEAARLGALALAHAATSPDQALVTEHRKDGWYAQRRVLVVELPCRDADLQAAMAREGATLLVLDEAGLHRHQPGWLEGGRFLEVGRFTAEPSTVVVLKPAAPR